MKSSVSINQRIFFYAPWFLFFLFLFIVIFSIQNVQKLSFNQNNKIAVDSELDQLLFKSKKIWNELQALERQNNSKSKNKNEYNNIANQYNWLVSSLNNSEYLQKNPQTKNEFIHLTNKIFTEIELARIDLESPKRTLASNSLKRNSFLDDYQKFKTNYLYQDFMNGLNKESFIFLCSSLLFGICCLGFTGLSVYHRKRLLNQLDQKESELKTFMSVMDNMSEGVIATDRIGMFTYYNQSALDIIGHEVKDIYYQSSVDLIGFHDAEGVRLTKQELPFFKATRKDLATDQEIFVKNKKNPEGIYISASNGLFINNNEETLGTVVVMKNISHKKQLEELWKKEKQLALEGSQKKSDFLASMSHEIRTPMNGIIGLTTLLSDTHLNPQQSEFVQTIRRSAYSLLALINDILDHSKIEAGKIELLPVHFDLAFLIKDISENFKQSNIEKNNTLSINLDPKIDKYYYADQNRIKQVFMNLIGNAIKFTQNGRITIHATLIKESNTDNTIRFCIEDTGPGMNQNELDRLFQRFFQTKTGVKFGGTGLGLNICKQLIDLMGGTIGVESTPNVGSKFWFELNLQKGNQSLVENNISKLSDFEFQFSGKVLVAEDNLINQKVTLQYLKNLGFEVDLVNNGLEAVQKFELKYQQDPNYYQLVLMDCNMPVMNGYEATKKINHIQSESVNFVPVIALTAEGQNTGMKKCLDAGMVDFINKPILIPDLVSVLKKYCKCNDTQTNSSIDVSALNKLKEFSSDDDSLLNVLFQDFISSTPDLIHSMTTSITTQDYESVYVAAHTLKSTAATLGVTDLSRLAEDVESLSQPNENNLFDFKMMSVQVSKMNLLFEKSKKELQDKIQQIEKTTKAAS